MSIYSGFATGNQQQIYDYFVHDLIFILSKRIIKFYQNQNVDELKFTSLIKQFFLKLANLEKNKYLEPNLSTALYSMMEYILKKQGFSSYEKQIQFFQKKNTFWVKVQKNQSQTKSQKSLNLNKQISKTINQKKQIPRKNNSNQKKLNQLSNQKQKQPKSILKSKYKFNSTNKIQEYNPQIMIYERQKKNKILFNQTIRFRDVQKHLKQIPNRSSSNTKNRNLKNQTSFRKQYLESSHFNHTSQESKEYVNKYENPIYCRDNRHRNQQTICKHCKNQRPTTKNVKSSRIMVPQLVKQYIHSTNHDYMKHFRKRKVRQPQQYP